MKITVFSSKRFERDFLDAHPDLLKSDPPLELTFCTDTALSNIWATTVANEVVAEAPQA